MCNAARSSKRAKTLPAGILKDQCCLLEESESQVRRRVRFSAQVTVNCIERAPETKALERTESSNGSRRGAFHRASAVCVCLAVLGICSSLFFTPSRCDAEAFATS